MTGIEMSVKVGGLTEARLALGRVDRDAEAELRDANRRIAQALAHKVQAAAHTEGAQADILASTVKTGLGPTPSVWAGGTRLIGSNHKPAYKLLFGSEFGARQQGPGALRQFKPHLGRGSYWFYRTVESNEDMMRREWQRAVDAVIRKFEGGDRG